MSWIPPSATQAAHSALPSDGPSEAEIAALRRLSSFIIADDDDAGNVIDVINSLTQTYLQYKTRTLSTPVRELLFKSLKNGTEGLECMLKHHGVENMKPLEKFSDINNPTTRCASNVLRQFSSKWKEEVENDTSRNNPEHAFEEMSYSDRGITMQNTELARGRNDQNYPMGQSSHGWSDGPVRSGAVDSFGDRARNEDPYCNSSGSKNFYRGSDNASLQSNKEGHNIVDLFKSYRSRSKF